MKRGLVVFCFSEVNSCAISAVNEPSIAAQSDPISAVSSVNDFFCWSEPVGVMELDLVNS